MRGENESEPQDSRQVFSMKQLKCESVVVYTDRAEVKRLVCTKLKKGENEIVIQGVSESIDADSVRVEGIGHAMVLDVVCEEKRIEINKTEDNSQRDINELETRLEELGQKMSRIDKQSSVLSDFAETTARPDRAAGSGFDLEKMCSPASVQNFVSFLEVYNQNMEKLHSERHTVKKEITQLEEKIKVLKENSENSGSDKNFREAL